VRDLKNFYEKKEYPLGYESHELLRTIDDFLKSNLYFEIIF